MPLSLTVVEPEGNTVTHIFPGDEVTIGRSSRNLLRINPDRYQQVSRMHSIIRKNDTGDYVYEDKESTHGSYFHGRKLRGPQILFRGDSVVIGAEGPSVTVNWPLSRVTGHDQTYLKQRPRNSPGFPLCFSQGFIQRFRLYEKIAAGGFGEVWRAVPVDGSPPSAIKLLHPMLLDPDHLGERDRNSLVRRFAREARLQHLLSHAGVPGVVRVQEWGDDPDRDYLYIIMDLVQGDSLDRVVMRSEQVEQEIAARYMLRISQALDAAHNFEFLDEKGVRCRGVLHRDIKPNNIIVDSATDEAWLVDFGIARIREGGELLTSLNVTVGTLQFLPPETLGGNEYTAAMDLWGFTVTLFLVLTRGRFPYQGLTRSDLIESMRNHRLLDIASVRPDLDPSLVAALRRSLDPTPANRVQTFGEWSTLLQRVSQLGPTGSRRSGS